MLQVEVTSYKPSVSGYTDGRNFMKYGIEILYKNFRASSSFVKIPLNVSRTSFKAVSEILPCFRNIFVSISTWMVFGTECSVPICFSVRQSIASRDVRMRATLQVLLVPLTVTVNGAHSAAVGHWCVC